jgi:hypothetical protein
VGLKSDQSWLKGPSDTDTGNSDNDNDHCAMRVAIEKQHQTSASK